MKVTTIPWLQEMLSGRKSLELSLHITYHPLAGRQVCILQLLMEI